MDFLIKTMFFLGIIIYLLGLIVSLPYTRKFIHEYWYKVAYKNEPINRSIINEGVVFLFDNIYNKNNKLSMKKFLRLIIILNISFVIGFFLLWKDINLFTQIELGYTQYFSLFLGFLLSSFFFEYISYKITNSLLQKYKKSDSSIYLLLDVVIVIFLFIVPVGIYGLFIGFEHNKTISDMNFFESMFTFSIFGNFMPITFGYLALYLNKKLSLILFVLPALSISLPTVLWILFRGILSSKKLLNITEKLLLLDKQNPSHIKNIGISLFTLSTGIISYLSYYP